MPRAHLGRQQPRGGPHEDEADVGNPEAPGEIASDVDLEAAGEDHIAVAHDAALPDGVEEVERHDERRRPRLNDGGRQRVVRTPFGGKPERNDHRGDRGSAADEPGHDSECADEGGCRRVERHATAASSKTSTRVPVSANPNSMAAS